MSTTARRLGRNTRDVTPDKFIEHHIAEDDDLAIANGAQLAGPF